MFYRPDIVIANRFRLLIIVPTTWLWGPDRLRSVVALLTRPRMLWPRLSVPVLTEKENQQSHFHRMYSELIVIFTEATELANKERFY